MNNLPGDSIEINRRYLDSLMVEGRLVGACQPTTVCTFLGQSFEMPIMTAALSHIDLVGMAEGAEAAGAPVSIGMGDNEELRKVLATGARVMKIIKPYADPEMIYSRIRFAEENGAMAVGMDIEHAFHADSAEPDNLFGLELKLPTEKELRDLIASTRLPFFVKGAMSVQDAERCANLGCRGIILSHHNGLLRYAVPPAALLPGIRAVVGDRLLLIVDGGMESGYDIYKVLALGADLVTVGKALMQPLKENGADGVRDILKTMDQQLSVMMVRTGIPDLLHLDPSVLWQSQGIFPIVK